MSIVADVEVESDEAEVVSELSADARDMSELREEALDETLDKGMSTPE